MWVINHSILLKLVPFESLGTIFYLHFIVTMAVSLAICEIYSIEYGVTLKNWVRARSNSL